jgi:large-conductance mechanosensitive channel
VKAAREAGASVLVYSIFINRVNSFVILGFALFMIVKEINIAKPIPKWKTNLDEPNCSTGIGLLAEMRDIFKK